MIRPFRTPFDEDRTKKKTFYRLDESQTDVDMMYLEYLLFAYQGKIGQEKVQAVKLPFDTPGITLNILLPPRSQFTKFAQNMTAMQMKHFMSKMRERYVSLDLPRFKVESEINLSDVMKKLGVKSLFNTNIADLSGVSGANNVHISSVIHRGYLSVDEKGAEAAAASEMTGMDIMELEERPIQMIVDHPFFAWIHDAREDLILFFSRINEP